MTWQQLEVKANEALATGDIGAAAAQLIDAIELAPKEPGLYRQLVQVTLLGGSTQTALQAAKELQALEPNSAEAHYLVGLAAMAHGELVLAETSLDHAAAKAPRSWQIRQALAQVAKALKKNGRAAQALEEAVKLAPTEPAIVVDYATMLLELKEPQKAKEVLSHAVKVHPTEARLRVVLAEVHVAIGESYEAQLHATEALGSDDELVRQRAREIVASLKKS